MYFLLFKNQIPESAVVMPDDAVTSLDVQFGALQFGTDASPFDFTTGDNSNSYQELGQRFLKLDYLYQPL